MDLILLGYRSSMQSSSLYSPFELVYGVKARLPIELEPLGIVHSDLYGKLSSPSLGGTEYFLTFIDDKMHYVWTYALTNKHEVFKVFKEWKSLVEKVSNHQLKILRTADNGGEYCSTEFEDFLKKDGIKHE